MKIIIVGGGTAGWLTAAIIAAQHNGHLPGAPELVLIESENVPTIGVGEGTWPTMRNTLSSIGLKECDVFKRCNAAFKQGGKFVNWVSGNNDYYYHPFTVPTGYGRIDLAPYLSDITHFATLTNFQQDVCEAGLAPRTLAEQEYQGSCNYGYHLDAAAFGELLKEKCTNDFGVTHIVDDVKRVAVSPNGEIMGLTLENQGEISGELYIDCSGMHSILLGKALNVPMVDVSAVLFNDRALAVQVPYPSDAAPLASHTIATAQNAGWIWDIGLTSRRGVGHVYSSRYLSDDEAESNLRRYIGDAMNTLTPRKIEFNSGYRAEFWKNNCVAVGMAAGFVEPLEATAIMLVELSARYIADNLIPDSAATRVIAKRFNEQMHYRWQRIIDFLKLHYMLTKRQEQYWKDHTNPETIPDSLKDDLAIWHCRGPRVEDFKSAYELFPAASYQYVIYGMGFKPEFEKQEYLYQRKNEVESILRRTQQLTTQLLQNLPPHREYIAKWLSQH